MQFRNRDTLLAIKRMAHLAEYREGDNANHLERVKGYSFIMARGLGLQFDDAEMIAVACQLHDIGKIIIPDEIAKKTENLEPHEWKIIESHTEVGAALLRGYSFPIMQIAETVAYAHHERWDGSGYPRGISGEEIPISARICAVADVFDALTTKRPYKQEMSITDALDLLFDSRDKLFDPKIIDVFLVKIDDIRNVRTNHPDS